MYAGIPGRRYPPGYLRHSGSVRDRPPPSQIPDGPGSYQFRDKDGRVLYVGKAKSLRSRVSNYFADPATLPARGEPPPTAPCGRIRGTAR